MKFNLSSLTPNRVHKPSSREVERLRLLLSTYQDGTGMNARPGGMSLPGWRDFERAVALAFDGVAQESKFIFDVLLRNVGKRKGLVGLSCKMRRELNRIDRDGRVTIEVSNSAGKFWDYLNAEGIDQTNYKSRPADVGAALIELVEKWHDDGRVSLSDEIDLDASSFLVLSWSRDGWYQLHQFGLRLPHPESLQWPSPNERSRRIVGADDSGNLFEWYGESGGQLKYYPLAEDAVWRSERFRLEPLGEKRYGTIEKVAAYFPEQWSKLG